MIDEDLNDRYNGDAVKLHGRIIEVDADDIIVAVQTMLENGCFCPSCMLSYLDEAFTMVVVTR